MRGKNAAFCTILLSFINLIIILLGIAVFRALILHEDEILDICNSGDVDYIPDNRGISGRFSEALKFQTINYGFHNYNRDALSNFISFLTISFPFVHSSPLVSREVVNNLSLLYYVQGSNKKLKPYLLSGHLDVVPVEESQWEVPPFSGLIKDGYIWGRGSIDCKHIVMGILEALEFLLEKGYQPQRSFYIAFGHDEESNGMDGAQQISSVLKSRNVELEYILDEGTFVLDSFIPGIKSPVAFLSVSEKGSLNLEVKVKTVAGHSSTPPRETAIVILAKALSKYMRNPVMSALQRTTTAVTTVTGGTKLNVLPSSASAQVNLRVHPAQTTEEALNFVQKVINDDRVEVEVLSEYPPHPISPIDTFGFVTIRNSIKQIYKDSCVVPTTLIANTDTRWYLNLTNSIYRFSLVRMLPSGISRFHGHNERISIKNYLELVNFFLHLIKNSDGADSVTKHTHEDL
ncbi:N-fatty-acyl-amino acid synthase/hydrolase PM20D1-like isoform X2 [Stegodyphus dumicola]|uniref:N-fatty-acyl-amino acid synthase/hydrolase PM20D1-like isoform X2 n=1 Tax=Stegodyphus dumicola TaxID=202533 RepID=UPI0015AB9977|nr:N-fatty-acyl-amino acid synthase/hydrolase PM20D1-like isoform X2 [Stegodyphus dumicola]